MSGAGIPAIRSEGVAGGGALARRATRWLAIAGTGPVLLRTAGVVRHRTGRRISAQLVDILRLRLGAGRLPVRLYYAYELYSPDRDHANRASFVGWTPTAVTRRLNDPHWRAVCDDRLMTYALLDGLGLSCPRVRATFDPGGRRHGAVPSFRSPEDLAAFLRHGMAYPFFGIPVSDPSGVGVSSVDAYDSDTDTLRLGDGRALPVEEYIREFPATYAEARGRGAGQTGGYLFQERLVPHPESVRVCGGLSSLRLVILHGDAGPTLFRGFWRLPTEGRFEDSLALSSSNTTICWVDHRTGRVERAVQGARERDGSMLGVEEFGAPVVSHSGTGVELLGTQPPLWTEAVELCMRAAAALPGVRYQTWDVALAEGGPVLMQTDYDGGAVQIPPVVGLNDPEFAAFLAAHTRPNGRRGLRKVVGMLRRAPRFGVRGSLERAGRVARKAWDDRTRGVRLVRTALVVREQTGKPLRTQCREIVALRTGPGRIDPFDYYAYDLFDDRKYTPEERTRFTSLRPDDISTRVNDPGWRGLCDDKLVADGIFRGLGLATPRLLALYHPGGRSHGAVPCLRTPERMADFLRHQMSYPFFGKPVRDSHGGGASAVEGIDRDRDVLLLRGGEEVPVESYVREVPADRVAGHRFRADRVSGYLFQDRMAQHPSVDHVTGGRVSTLRLVVLIAPDGRPMLFRARWRIPAGGNITDNFVAGTGGNLVATVDRATGRVREVVMGPGPAGTPVYGLGAKGRPVQRHPDTGEWLIDLRLPNWAATVEKCLSAAAAFPGLRYQAWDIGIGPDGPIFLEVNFKGGISQSPGAPGFLDDEFRRFMRSYGYR